MFDIPKRLEEDIRQWCSLNGISDANAYVSECVEKQFNLDRYGDLNIIMFGDKSDKTEDNKTETTAVKPKKTTTRKKKKVDNGQAPELFSVDECETKENGTVIADIETETKAVKPEGVVEPKNDINNGESTKKATPIRKKRVLETK